MAVLFLFLYIVLHWNTYATPQRGYFVDSEFNCNNVYGAIFDPDDSTQWVTSLGKVLSTKDCIAACLSASNASNRCESYTYHTKPFGGKYANYCFARFGYPLWTPINQNFVNCGRIIWHCTTNRDCSLNGICNKQTGNCSCNIGWKGYKCGYLDLDNVINSSSGYIIMNDTDNDNKPTSSWGGSVIVSNDINSTNKNKYHMFVTEFDNHCGLNSFLINSIITHAISTNGWNSPYQRLEIVHSHFAAEPDIIRGNNSEYVLYYNTFNYSTFPECHCNDGSTPPGCKIPDNPQFITVMQYTRNNNKDYGPYNQYFTDPMVIFSDRPNDTDLSGVINKNGQFFGMSRINNITQGSEIHLVTTNNWKDAKSYHEGNKILFPELTPLLTEDPFLWIDCNGYYHALFHNMSPHDEQQICGGHAFSSDGINWIYGGASYGNIVHYDNGTSHVFTRRERPHLIFDDDNCTPLALTNGVQYDGGDATYTLLQPIKQYKDEST